MDGTFAKIKTYSNNTHSDSHKFSILYKVLLDSSKCLKSDKVLVQCAYPAEDPNLELCQRSGVYNFTEQ